MSEFEKTCDVILSPALDELAASEGITLLGDRVAMDALALSVGATLPRELSVVVTHTTRDRLVIGFSPSLHELYQVREGNSVSIEVDRLDEQELLKVLARELATNAELNPSAAARLARTRKILTGSVALEGAGLGMIAAGKFTGVDALNRFGKRAMMLGAGVATGALIEQMWQYSRPVNPRWLASLNPPIRIQQDDL